MQPYRDFGLFLDPARSLHWVLFVLKGKRNSEHLTERISHNTIGGFKLNFCKKRIKVCTQLENRTIKQGSQIIIMKLHFTDLNPVLDLHTIYYFLASIQATKLMFALNEKK